MTFLADGILVSHQHCLVLDKNENFRALVFTSLGYKVVPKQSFLRAFQNIWCLDLF